MKPKYSLDIEICRDELEYLEGEIINKLVDRAQFALNAGIYSSRPSALDEWLELLERPYAVLGRFSVPEERPFTRDLPPPRRTFTGGVGIPVAEFRVNLNEEIRKAYVGFLPEICANADDDHFGSSIEYDFMALRAISKRIHFGAYYIAAGKYCREPDALRPFIERRDLAGTMAALTSDRKEEEIVARIGAKARRMQAAVHPFRPSWRTQVDPEAIVRFYRDTIIPLTKRGQALFLLDA
ncbi:MAG: chorismate mutase, partial [Planctomycetes bacterium]|nr:chorismate mutase [Planctomycetota bacterium]